VPVNEAGVYSVSRPDVAAAFNHPSAARTGFPFKYPRRCAAGSHDFAAIAIDAR
jgi:hypothetical protein